MPDKHPQGGDLFDMAKDGTKGSSPQNIIPSVPRPDQKNTDTAGGLGAPTLQDAADNAAAIKGFGEVISAGGAMPEDVGQKYSLNGGKERGQRQSAPSGGRNQPSHGS
ncbi:hypothetical protein B0T18DRAFT_321869 [Schizothecium vesticola]|uniref:Uncharacterized protein n=1 Tax=Schizothecium vesticola TaxID=314040 RepID=A0AA40F3P7_9PEZI|nr:hypothetical protein B0T18DRAFT_321869 [Schizothecium vesticola]